VANPEQEEPDAINVSGPLFLNKCIRPLIPGDRLLCGGKRMVIQKYGDRQKTAISDPLLIGDEPGFEIPWAVR